MILGGFRGEQRQRNGPHTHRENVTHEGLCGGDSLIHWFINYSLLHFFSDLKSSVSLEIIKKGFRNKPMYFVVLHTHNTCVNTVRLVFAVVDLRRGAEQRSRYQRYSDTPRRERVSAVQRHPAAGAGTSAEGGTCSVCP